MDLKITVKICDQELSLEEAKKLYEELSKIFEKKATPDFDFLKSLKDKTEPDYPKYRPWYEPYKKPIWLIDKTEIMPFVSKTGNS